MRKKILGELPLLSLPAKVNMKNLNAKSEIKHIVLSKIHSIKGERILEVDFYSLELKKIYMRIFISKKDFITQLVSDERKWSAANIEYLFGYKACYYEKSFVALNSQTEKRIQNFLFRNPKEQSEYFLFTIRKFQQKIQDARLAKKHLKITTRIDNELAGVKGLPRNFDKWIEKTALRDFQYIFYKKEGKYHKGYCTSCKSEVYPDGVAHKKYGICPKCKSKITFMAKGRSKNYYHDFVFSYLQKLGDDSFAIRIFTGLRGFSDGYEKSRVFYSEERRYLINGIGMKPYYWGEFKNTGKYRWCEGWENKGNFYYCSPNDKGALYTKNLKPLFKDMIWQDCKIAEYFDQGFDVDVFDYLKTYYKNPQIRYLVENGLCSLVEEKIESMYYSQNDETWYKLFEILRNYKEFFKMFGKIKIWKQEVLLLEHFPRNQIKAKVLLWLRDKSFVSQFANVLKYTTPIKAMNYMEKNVTELHDINSVFTTWNDYLRFANFLNYDMSSSFVLFPKNLYEKHDRLHEDYESKKDSDNDSQIEKMFEPLSRMYSYEDNEFLIRPPLSAKEIKDEGSALRHCVSSYVEMVADFETTVLFLRAKNEPDKPFYTVEYKDSRITQCQGYRNAKTDAKIKKFLNKWERYLVRNIERERVAA